MTRQPRKITQFLPCPTHHGYFAGLTRYRKAEGYCEGGPAHGPACTGQGCQIKPGRDLFIEEICADTYSTRTPESPFFWDCNKEEAIR